MVQTNFFFDNLFPLTEQLPREFTVSFNTVENAGVKAVKVLLNDDIQLGDTIDDNAYTNDYYRYHDIFHYTFATLLAWSPCTRALMKCKRKSKPQVDKVEDGARATITEESISLIIFNEARKKGYFENDVLLSRTALRLIKEMTDQYEVRVRSEDDWQHAVQVGYRTFRKLITNEGGKVYFNSLDKVVTYL